MQVAAARDNIKVMMNQTDQINQAVLKLWESTFDNSADVWMPLICPPIRKVPLLFVGLNPSFSLKGFRIILKDTPYSHIDPEEFFHWRNRKGFDVQIAQALETLARSKYPFFAKFKDIAQHVAVDWEHVDLFFCRETSQNKCKEKIYGTNGLNEFGRRQFELSKAIIFQVQPKVIVVANAFAARLFNKEFAAKFDVNRGYHIVQLEGQVVPTFLASMLTGQRAMDVYSYQRLQWHIRKAFEDVKN